MESNEANAPPPSALLVPVHVEPDDDCRSTSTKRSRPNNSNAREEMYERSKRLTKMSQDVVEGLRSRPRRDVHVDFIRRLQHELGQLRQKIEGTEGYGIGIEGLSLEFYAQLTKDIQCDLQQLIDGPGDVVSDDLERILTHETTQNVNAEKEWHDEVEELKIKLEEDRTAEIERIRAESDQVIEAFRAEMSADIRRTKEDIRVNHTVVLQQLRAKAEEDLDTEVKRIRAESQQELARIRNQSAAQVEESKDKMEQLLALETGVVAKSYHEISGEDVIEISAEELADDLTEVRSISSEIVDTAEPRDGESDTSPMMGRSSSESNADLSVDSIDKVSEGLSSNQDNSMILGIENGRMIRRATSTSDESTRLNPTATCTTGAGEEQGLAEQSAERNQEEIGFSIDADDFDELTIEAATSANPNETNVEGREERVNYVEGREERVNFWSKELHHRDIYTKSMIEFGLYEYSRRYVCINVEESRANAALVSALMKECVRAYGSLYGYRTGLKANLVIATHQYPAMVGRSGKILSADVDAGTFQLELVPTKNDKIAKKAAAADDNDKAPIIMEFSVGDIEIPEIKQLPKKNTSKGKGPNRGKGNRRKLRNTKNPAQAQIPMEYRLKISEDVDNDIRQLEFTMMISTLEDLACVYEEPAAFTEHLEKMMVTRTQEDDAAKALEEEEEQGKAREAEEREKQEIAKRFRQYEKEINGRRKKARRILSSGKSKFVKGLKSKPEAPEKLYYDSDSLTSSIYNGFVDLLVTLHEGENDDEACALMEAIREAEFSPNAVEYDESSETTRTCFLFEDDNHKIPLCIVDYEFQQAPDSRDIPSSTEEEVDSVMNSIMEQHQYDEICSETGLQKGDAFALVHSLIQIEKDSDTEVDLSPRVVKRFIRHDLLDVDFVQEILSRDEVGSDQAQLFLKAVSQHLSKRLSFDLSDLVRKLVHEMELDGEQVSDSDQDFDSASEMDGGIPPFYDHVDHDLFAKFCKITGLTRQDACMIVAQYPRFSCGIAVAQELDRLPELYLGKLIESGFLNHRLVGELLNADGSSMSGEMLLTLVDRILERRHKFSLSDLVVCIEEIPSDGDETVVTAPKVSNGSESDSESDSESEYEC